jgi:hypothetical protein
MVNGTAKFKTLDLFKWSGKEATKFLVIVLIFSLFWLTELIFGKFGSIVHYLVKVDHLLSVKLCRIN